MDGYRPCDGRGQRGKLQLVSRAVRRPGLEKRGGFYTWGVRLTWIVTGTAFAAVFFLIPTSPGGKARASLLLSGLFGIFALSGGIGHLLLFAMNHPLKRIENNERATNLWRYGFGLLWFCTPCFIIYFAVSFTLAVNTVFPPLSM